MVEGKDWVKYTVWVIEEYKKCELLLEAFKKPEMQYSISHILCVLQPSPILLISRCK